ncbi:glycosyltransferase [Thioalbus denitrificans]|uniref:Glycosyltransferase involved in cell wall biosynthesis n=1 Tax=Thioalbus denitrificans TaxID=547122 RepID=A0A369CK82_9GAMM|nr:glycosyltransferase [Thioalbus denitrificans]RCX32254.1 glycosyltransferase involved in cell wall biosynthesis [Thioalbus denitrificans]
MTATCIVFLGYPIGDDGAPHQAMSALQLSRNNISVTYIAWGNQPPPDWLVEYPQLNYILVKKSGVASALLLVKRMLHEARKARVKYIYVQGAQQTPFAAILWMLGSRRRTIYHTQDFLGPGQHWLYEITEQFVARRADVVICNEVNRARFMASLYRLPKMPEVVPTALPADWPVPARDESLRRGLLSRLGMEELSGARLVIAGGPYGVDRMSPESLRALAQLPDNFALVFTGMDDSSRRAQLEADPGYPAVCGRVLCLERLPFDYLLRVYAACDIGLLLYPNSGIGHFYQCPGRLTEYLRCGLPVVAANYPGLDLLVRRHDIGAVADPYDPEEIGDVLARLGGVSSEELAATRARVQQIAVSNMNYEREAGRVWKRVFERDS